MYPVAVVIERTFRAEAGAVLASLIRVTGDFELAEDALHDALAVALERWPEDGIPTRPGAWITTAARRKAIDRLRRAATARDKSAALQALVEIESRAEPGEQPEVFPDDRLRLIFTCCHPALRRDAQVALTLRTLGGLTTAEIASAFLVPTPTMAQRLVRAKSKIKSAKIPYEVPRPDQLQVRTAAVLSVLYLIFNEGYYASSGADAVRKDLCDEGIRLARLVRALMADDPEVLGLLALMLLHDSRRGARDRLLVEQDRSLWNAERIAEGRALIANALRMGRPGPYQLQAAIAAVHAESPCAAETDWRQIAGLYAELRRRAPSPIVDLNRAVAVSMADGPDAGLALLEGLAHHPELRDYQPYHAARADLLRRTGRLKEAVAAYRLALASAPNQVSREFLRRRLNEVEAALGGDSGL